jgi:hypothetical protein
LSDGLLTSAVFRSGCRQVMIWVRR